VPGAAIDHTGRILAGKDEILKVVREFLNLPRASPEIDRWAYFNITDKTRYPTPPRITSGSFRSMRRIASAW
jgi:hypothetical protein